MATFYLLPPRSLVEETWSRQVEAWLPGLPVGVGMVDALQSAAAGHPDVYVVFREELPDEAELAEALRDGFGAAVGDEVVEVRLRGPGLVQAVRWRVGERTAA